MMHECIFADEDFGNAARADDQSLLPVSCLNRVRIERVAVIGMCRAGARATCWSKSDHFSSQHTIWHDLPRSRSSFSGCRTWTAALHRERFPIADLAAVPW